MTSDARRNFDANKGDIDRLWQIHRGVVGSGRGRKHDVDVLNRAAMVFITACWEAYVEDVAMEAFDYLLAKASSAKMVPSKVRALAAADLVKAQDSSVKVWDLADAGWQTVLKAHRAAVKTKWVESLNTPKKRQVDDLFENLLGMKSLSSAWTWQRMKNETAGEKLDKFITVRGQIAHRLTHDKSVYKSWGTSYLSHVQKLVEKTDEAVRAHVEGLVGSSPW
jgi:hypothetical protein